MLVARALPRRRVRRRQLAALDVLGLGVRLAARALDRAQVGRLEQVARGARVNIPFNCKNGKCGTCEVLLDGSRVVKTCQTKVGKKDMSVDTK